MALFAFVTQAPAQAETQHVFNFPWQVSPTVELTLHARMRTRPSDVGLYQGRGGMLLRKSVHSNVGLVAGYYFSEQEESLVEDWEAWNRYFGGFDHRLFRWRGSWDARHFAEFFDAPGDKNYYRVRHRAGWTAPTRVAPYANIEFFWDRDGWRSTRWQAGTAWRLSARTTVDAHYFYEPRRTDVGPAPRHMWGTTLQVRLGKLK
jgi:hypothetical protein